MKKLYTLSLLSVLLMSVGINAQVNHRLLLGSGTFELSPSNTTEALSPLDNEGMTMIRVIQFTRPLLQEEQEFLSASVGEVMGYLPINAYLMTLPSGISQETFSSLPLHAVSPLTPEMKMTERLFYYNIPDYAWRGDRRIEVVGGFSSNTNVQLLAEELRLDGWDVVDVNVGNQSITFEIQLEERDALATLPQMIFLQVGEDPGEKENLSANRNSRSSAIKNVFSSGRNYDGSGIVVGLGDDGDIGPHIDFTGRIIARNTNASTGDHGDHVAGTIFGAGNIDQTAEGMAPGADMVYYRYPRNLNNIDTDYGQYAIRVTNSSYSNGCNAGYTNFTRQMDQDIIQHPLLMHVFSAGNSGTSDCGYGAGTGWGNVTGGHKIAKNVIATANVQFNDNIATSSSRGPSADGRIKPDVAAVGTSVYSTIDGHRYGNKTGTSMSSPGVAGSAAQLMQAYKTVNGTEANGGLIKAIMMNSADDLGNTGPDFIYGYGRINNYRATQTIERGDHIQGTVVTGETDTVQFSVPNGAINARVMVYWNDPAALVNASRALVNNIDAYAKIESSASNIYPYVLDPTPNVATLGLPAVQAIDSLNNAEQMFIGNSASNSSVKIVVTGTNIPSGPQDYFVVLSYEVQTEITYPFGGNALIAGSSDYIMLNDNNSSSAFNFEYSTNNGSSWTPLSTSPAFNGGFSWTVPNIVSSNVLIRVLESGSNIPLDTTDHELVIAPRPSQLSLVRACPGDFTISWRPVSGAAEYEVYTLGQKYMDSVNTTVDTFYTFTGYSPADEVWYSVAAVPTAGGPQGPRALARMKPTGVQNCILNRDLSSLEMISPQPGEIPDCQNLSAMPIILNISNLGITDLDTLPYAVSINNTISRDTIFTTLTPGQSILHTFPVTVNATSVGNYEVRVWGELSSDDNTYNDTLTSSFEVVSGVASNTVNFVEDFDSWSTCSNATNCGGTTCSLPNGWNNYDNGVLDGIDWRTYTGSTSSSGTGPSSDHTTGNGNYLYIEASGGCSFEEAILITPCIDLSTATLPEFSFWYHMNGPDINELHVDMLVDGEWMLDIVNPLVGSQGNQWQQKSLSLFPYLGKMVNFRFRATTGADYQGDIAIDDISVINTGAAPVAAIDVSEPSPCIGETVQLFDQSTNVPSAWTWSITPSTFSFVNGTNANSQNPEVQFNALGNYQITLNASNTNGSDIAIDSSISVGNGATLPYSEDFENGFLPVGWSIENQDQLTTWESQTCYGANGAPTVATRVNNYGYNSAGQVDVLEGVSIDLMSTVNPTLVFDVAYGGQPGNTSDRLVVEVSSDCGASWMATGYDLTGSALTTTAALNREYIPGGSAEWRRDSVDLSAYAGMSLKMRFLNYTGGGNCVYLDNIQVYDLNVALPTDTLFTDLKDSCIANTFVFSYPGANATNVVWDFGNGASPQTATGAGPHNVDYAFSGSKLVSMSASNAGGLVNRNEIFNLFVKPVANFGHAFMPNDSVTVQFLDFSVGNVDTYFWDFNDNGATSNLEDPVHTFSTGGDFEVTLIVDNRCGPDTLTKFIYGVSLPEDAPDNWILAPNPATTQLTLFVNEGELNVSEATIYTLSGKALTSHQNTLGNNRLTFDVSTYPAGIYILSVRSESGLTNIRFVVQR